MNETTNGTAAGFSALARAGLSALDAWMKSMIELARIGTSLNPVLQNLADAQRRRSCEIPPPCWMPKSLGEIHSLACPGGTAVVRIRVTNCQARPGRVRAAFAEGSPAGEVAPDELVLSPMERGWFTARLALPDDACKGQKIERILWVRGCNAHYLRWVVEAAEGGASSCHAVDVEDCADPIHHWYDHFYCDRPCTHQILSTTDQPG
jgi:hypothetical protein